MTTLLIRLDLANQNASLVEIGRLHNIMNINHLLVLHNPGLTGSQAEGGKTISFGVLHKTRMQHAILPGLTRFLGARSPYVILGKPALTGRGDELFSPQP